MKTVKLFSCLTFIIYSNIEYVGQKGIKGEKGGSGSPGPTGLTGPKGVTGQKDMKGDKEEENGGTVYVRWGHDECPSTAQLVYIFWKSWRSTL